MSGKGAGGHHSARAGSHVWLTPPAILQRLGAFGLDPCAAPEASRWPTARVHYATPAVDSLATPWRLCPAGRCPVCSPVAGRRGGTEAFCPDCRNVVEVDAATEARVYLNPPYGPHLGRWMARLAAHGRGTALIFRSVWEAADALLFIEGRLHFHRPDGTRSSQNAGAPSVLYAYGREDAAALMDSGIAGQLVGLRRAVLVHLAARVEDPLERPAEAETWREVVAETLRAMGGGASLGQLYAALESHPRARGLPNWRERVRQTMGRMRLERTAPGRYRIAA